MVMILNMLDLIFLRKSDENKFEVIPSTNFKNPFKKFYHQYIMRQDPYSLKQYQTY